LFGLSEIFYFNLKNYLVFRFFTETRPTGSGIQFHEITYQILSLQLNKQTKNMACFKVTGFKMYIGRLIFRSDMVQICNDLSVELTRLTKSPVRIVPDNALHGGFLWIDEKSARTQGPYKSMRFNVSCTKTGPYENIWPSVPANVMEEWKHDRTLLLPKTYYVDTVLKSYHGTSSWKQEEVLVFVSVLRRHEITCTKIPGTAKFEPPVVVKRFLKHLREDPDNCPPLSTFLLQSEWATPAEE
jgi:hypothetical protein